jgi:polar amino acid transport system substrate-binding protein
MNGTMRLRGFAAALCTASALVLMQGIAAQAIEVTDNMSAEAAWMKLLPADVASKGVLEGATTDSNAPWSFVEPDSGKPAGADVDLMNEAAKRLGLTINWNAIQFTAGIPGVQAGRYDFYVSAMADTVARQEVVDFIDYSEEGSGVIVKKGNPLGIETFEDLCGKTVSIVTGSLFPAFVEDLNKNCDTPIVLSETADQSAPYLAVASGQADATMNTYGVANYALTMATDGIQTQLELSPVPRFIPATQGYAFAKEKSDLMAALAGAMQSMAEDGTYQKIMDNWAVGDAVLNPITLNNALF